MDPAARGYNTTSTTTRTTTALRIRKAVAERLGATPAQVAIAWTLAQGEHVIPIPGTKKMRRWERLEENAAAADLELPEDALAELDQVPVSVAPRY
jgi:aryl-alcohol dehydrogenase-like predicted oxidoreductase